jgi:hypothetical protein
MSGKWVTMPGYRDMYYRPRKPKKPKKRRSAFFRKWVRFWKRLFHPNWSHDDGL